MSRIPVIVLTGGPGSGKSTILKSLGDRDDILCVPEAATFLISYAGIKAPDPGSKDLKHIEAFENAVFDIQVTLEEAAQHQARREGKRLIVVDRGTMDNLAFVPVGLDILSLRGTTKEAEYSRYVAVIHVGLPSKKVYDAVKSNNPARSENFDTAMHIAKKLRSVWMDHPLSCYVANDGTVEDLMDKVRIRINEAVPRSELEVILEENSILRDTVLSTLQLMNPKDSKLEDLPPSVLARKLWAQIPDVLSALVRPTTR